MTSKHDDEQDDHQVVFVGVHARRGDRLKVFHFVTFATFSLRIFKNFFDENNILTIKLKLAILRPGNQSTPH